MKKVKVLDKEFKISISAAEIQTIINGIAARINHDMVGKDIVFIGILNGSFMFAADLMKKIKLPCQITFLKFSSYQGTSSTGQVRNLIGINEDLKGKTLIILEDIVDTGITLEHIVSQLKTYEPEDIKIATLIFKPKAYQKNIFLDYIGMEIPNNFIVGYGLDYDGFGRNLEDIYTLITPEEKLNEKINLVLFGPPGAGKGTQAKQLIKKYQLIHISTGDMLRTEIADQTVLGMQAKRRIDKGEFVPDEMVIKMIESVLEKNKDAKGFIFDGFPRTISQAIVLDKLLEKKNVSVNAMMALDVEKEEVIQRILKRAQHSGRADDQDLAIINKRLMIYHEVTAPLIEYYKEQEKYYPISGNGSEEEIFGRICQTIDKI